jgi:hypothetical protein
VKSEKCKQTGVVGIKNNKNLKATTFCLTPGANPTTFEFTTTLVAL